MKNKKKIFVISYYGNLNGTCMAEWLDDKINSLKKLSYNIDVLTSSFANKYKSSLANHWRVSSISILDFYYELKILLSVNRRLRLYDWLLLPLVLTFGIILDLIQFLLIKGKGEGGWSWTPGALVLSVIVCIFKRPHIIMSTGGCASAHLVAVIVGKLFQIFTVVELQDPLSGENIGRNSRSKFFLLKFEKLLLNYADKIVYVTKNAASAARKNFKSEKIKGIYPGARKFNINYVGKFKKSKKFSLIHLGSLYSNRNLNSIINAIDIAIKKKRILSKKIELINMGGDNDSFLDTVRKKNYIKPLPPTTRIKAIKFASKCNVALLVQHVDNRSRLTIPYKTYDYLNLGIPIIAILNNNELKNLLKKNGHKVFGFNEIEKISDVILNFYENRASLNVKKNTLDPLNQTRKLLQTPSSRSYKSY
jgi:hypothetical protein